MTQFLSARSHVEWFRVTTLALLLVAGSNWNNVAQAEKTDAKGESSMLISHTVSSIEGKSVSLDQYRGQALLIVNTASLCGYTKQYADLVAIQKSYQEKGFTVLAFPCNDFGGQEPGDAKEIQSFCQTRFSVNFPLFEKVHAEGSEQSPLYKTLTSLPAPLGGPVRWNFTKFLVNPKGEVVARFEPGDRPTSAKVKKAIEAVLPK